MRGFVSKLRTMPNGSLPWLVATVILLGWEIQSLSQRGWSAALSECPVSRPLRELGRPNRDVATQRVPLATKTRLQREVIVVVGCLESDREGEVELTLSIEPSHSQTRSDLAAIVESLEMRTSRTETPRELLTTSDAVWRYPAMFDAARPFPVAAGNASSPRLFLLQLPRGSEGDHPRHVAIPCQLAAESSLIRIYVEESNGERANLEPLIAETLHLADTMIGSRIAELVGPVCDRDADGKLAVVLSHQLNQPGGIWAGVEGITQAGDFRREVPRPLGNQSDVIFLSSQLTPGERLRGVLAHEWSHAAIFSRRYCTDSNDHETIPTEDDWLNEALTHLIEVRAGDTLSNVTHRQQAFLERTTTAPLIVRDYTRPEFWRHHGCRGAAVSFLEWCHQRYGPQLVPHLAADRGVGIEHLEQAMGESFERLFRGWTTSLGRTLAQREATQRETGCRTTEIVHHAPQNCPKFHEWRPAADTSHSTITLRLRETTAAYVKLRLNDAVTHGDLVATSPSGCRLQLTVIPIETEE